MSDTKDSKSTSGYIFILLKKTKTKTKQCCFEIYLDWPGKLATWTLNQAKTHTISNNYRVES
jgi:hypothetical protein